MHLPPQNRVLYPPYAQAYVAQQAALPSHVTNDKGCDVVGLSQLQALLSLHALEILT